MHASRLIPSLGLACWLACTPCRATPPAQPVLARSSPLQTSKAAPPASAKPTGILSHEELETLTPPSVFFRGQTATVQMRNTAGVRFADGTVTLMMKVDTSGYATSVQERYQDYLITEAPLHLGGMLLPAGAYGVGFLASGFLVMNLGAEEIFTVPSTKDAALKRPLPLALVPDAAPGAFRFYSGRDYVVLSRAAAVRSAAEPLQFSDSPDFAIAGIVDYTAVGGHGSDATLRTSEDLTRATLASGSGKRAAPVSSRQELALRAAVEATPESYAANRALGEFYLGAARYQDAVPALEHASRLHLGAAEDEYALALACQGVGDAHQASAHAAHALSKVDSVAAYYRLAGELDEALGNPVGAVEQEQRAAQLDPSEENYFAWGSELLLHRAIWQAAEVFARGAAIHPGSPRLKTSWAAALFAGAKYEDAATQLCAASDLDPANREPYLMMSKIVLASPSPLACAEDRLSRFVALEPGDAEANYAEAMLLLKQGSAADKARAEPLLTKAIALKPDFAAAYLQLGILAAAAHRQDEAVADYQHAIAADPQQAEPHYRLGVLYDRAGKTADAQRELTLHEALVKSQTAAVEQQRRQVKQFVVTLDSPASASAKP